VRLFLFFILIVSCNSAKFSEGQFICNKADPTGNVVRYKVLEVNGSTYELLNWQHLSNYKVNINEIDNEYTSCIDKE